MLVTSDSCNAGVDVDFELSGFRISGSVRAESNGKVCQGRGPLGVTVSVSQNGETVARSTTGNDGRFSIEGLAPGSYLISATHASWTFAKDTAKVELLAEPLELTQPFIVSGFDVKGSVLSLEGDAIYGVQVSMSSNGDTEPLLQVESDSNGSFHFSSVPCGSYQLVARYEGQNAVFEVQPSSIEIKVQTESVKLSNPFRVVGFSAHGNVLNGDLPMSGVVILVNGVETTTTNEEGMYYLNRLTSGTYSIEARKLHFIFDTLSNQRITPSQNSLPTINVFKYQLCGRVLMSQSLSSKSPSRRIELTGNSISLSTQTDSDGLIFQIQFETFD